ncbi:MAG: RNA polymerase sigma factor [Rhodospirillaceae bacterium]|nr:RNA polymerase sigma factor [Rhodospirillaceae bacterium]
MARIEPYLGRLYRYAFSLCRNEDAARDLVQQCAVKALSAGSVPIDEAAFRSWLFVILRNTLIDDRRRHRSAESARVAVAEYEYRPEMEFWREDERLINTLSVKQAMGKLGENDREIIGLVDLAGLSYAEAADVLDIPVGTVMSRVSRARGRLLALLKPSNVTPIPLRKRRGG